MTELTVTVTQDRVLPEVLNVSLLGNVGPSVPTCPSLHLVRKWVKLRHTLG